MRLKEVMDSARRKVARANQHIAQLEAESRSLPQTLFDLKIEHRQVAPVLHPDRDLFRYVPKDDVPKYFGAIAGDAVNNLRESLDYWMNSAIRCVGPSEKVHFPFTAKKDDLEKSRNFRQVEKLFPEVAEFISDEIAPCRDENTFVWAATSLCNDNKHNDFLPLTTTKKVQGGHIMIGTNSWRECTYEGDASQVQDFLDAPLGSMRVIDGRFRVSIELIFPPGAVFAGKSVVLTLQKMSEEVSSSLDLLEAFIKPYCK